MGFKHFDRGFEDSEMTNFVIKENMLPPLPLRLSHLVGIMSLMLFVMTAVIVIERKLPPGLKKEDELDNPNKFIAQRAMEHLVELTSIGSRVCGSYENEVLAVHFFIKTIKKIKDEAKPHHIIDFDVQKSNGGFPITFLDGMTNVYRNVQSVVVRIGSELKSKHSLLLNCHFDTVPDSPGASDDGAGCAVMLEILHVISKSPSILKHNIIFLFNGAEENIMQASHGFITQHKWAGQVRAFINLEACGAGGREVMFQAGPNSPWIVETYSDSVPYPYASSLAQEIFESGFIPGDTDFRIFRDFGMVSGLDFAWSSNGYVYHTEFDDIKQIPLGTLQRTGDNILALSMGMASGHHLSDLATKEGQPVFFDILGAALVHLHVIKAAFIAVFAVLLSYYNIYLNMNDARKKASISRRAYLAHMRRGMILIVASCALSIVGSCLVAGLLSGLGRALSWYARPLWLLPLYGAQAIATPMAVALLGSADQRKNPLLRSWLLVQVFADALAVLWAFALLGCLALGVRSGFVPLLWVLCPAMADMLRHAALPHSKDWRRLALYVAGQALPFVQSFYLMLGCMYMIIPIMGRAGAGLQSEIVMAFLMSFLFMLVTNCGMPLVLGTKNPWRLIKYMYGVVLVSVGLVVLTPLGFPYSGDLLSPAPQRFMLLHTQRHFYTANGTLRHADHGYWMPNMDINSPHSVDSHVPEMMDAHRVNSSDCSEHLYCGMPYYLPVLSFISPTHWLPHIAPHIQSPVDLHLIRRETVNDTVLRIHLNVTGPNHIGIMLSPQEGASLSALSLTPDAAPVSGPLWGARRTYFVYTADASPIVKPWIFYVDVTHTSGLNPDYWLDITVAGHQLYGPDKVPPATKRFVDRFPAWTTSESLGLVQDFNLSGHDYGMMHCLHWESHNCFLQELWNSNVESVAYSVLCPPRLTTVCNPRFSDLSHKDMSLDAYCLYI